MPMDSLEERRKKTTLRKAERKHAGKITQPYAIMERLIKEVEDFAPLRKAKIIIVWKSGWKPSKDEILKHAQIRKLSELEREIWGDEFDMCMLLHRELWQSARFSEEEREMDIFHELCHPVPEIDDQSGDQLQDEKGRLCWRLRNHPIQRFPEEIERYGLEKVLNLEEAARVAADDERSQAEARAEENDARRPLLAAAAKNAAGNGQADDNSWKKIQAETLSGLTEKAREALAGAGIETLGQLQTAMAKGDYWAKDAGIHGRFRTPIEDAFNNFLVEWSTRQNEDDATAAEMHPDAKGTIRVHLLKTIEEAGVMLGGKDTVVEAFLGEFDDVFLAVPDPSRQGEWIEAGLESDEFEEYEEPAAA